MSSYSCCSKYSKIKRYCRQYGANDVHSIEFDASKEENCSNLIEQTRELYDGIDILILNHTGSIYQPLFNDDERTIIQQMKNLMNTNFFGYFLYK